MNAATQTSNEWHLMKGEHQYGPYTYTDMLQMKQNSMLFDFDYVWSPHLENWTMVGDLADFSLDRLTRLAMEGSNPEVFNRRSTPRMAVSLTVVAHDDKRTWTGQVQNISEGGALVLMENPLLLPGDLITLHVRASDVLKGAFNCTAQILNKRLTKSKIQHDTALHYAVKFLNLTEIGKQEVTHLFEKASQARNQNQKEQTK